MLQNIGTRIGPARAHPVGVSLMHRPLPHVPGNPVSSATNRPAAEARPRGIRNPFRKR